MSDKCRGYLTTYIDGQLAQAQLQCTVSKTEQQCPKAKVKRENECNDKERKTTGDCLQPFVSAADSLVNKSCILTDSMCEAAVTFADCLNKKYVPDKCRGYLTTYINGQLAQAQLQCTVSKTEQQCPKAKVKRENECNDKERKTIGDCLQPFVPAAASLVNKSCILTDSMCEVASKSAKCVNDASLANKCRTSLPTFIDNNLAAAHLKCTLSGIEKRCPNAKVNTGGAPQQVMLSLVCLFVSVIAGLHFTT
ncbi:uncharacterized protein LOC121387690 isoform X2 [Gigantopelta aegis]|nr:uncharacterized protein LOC121387690 isoform X2 [Gigantopelta aegis]